ncbi:ArdC-like ssDNA-binding domain-containing protein, partial [Marinobacter sp. 1Y8]
MAQDIHQIVTDKIIATMEAGEAGQWTCPWHRTGGGLPRNALTGKAYRGINTLSLWVGAQAAEAAKIGDTPEFKRKLAYFRDKLLLDDYLEQEAKRAVTPEAEHAIYDQTVKLMKPEEE